MRMKLYTLLLDYECPEGVDTKNCPLRKYLKTQKLFRVKKQDNVLEPTAETYRLARAEYVQAIAEMHNICTKCQNSVTDKIKR